MAARLAIENETDLSASRLTLDTGGGRGCRHLVGLRVGLIVFDHQTPEVVIRRVVAMGDESVKELPFIQSRDGAGGKQPLNLAVDGRELPGRHDPRPPSRSCLHLLLHDRAATNTTFSEDSGGPPSVDREPFHWWMNAEVISHTTKITRSQMTACSRKSTKHIRPSDQRSRTRLHACK